MFREPCVAAAGSSAGIAAQIGYKRRPVRYGGRAAASLTTRWIVNLL